MGEDDLDLMAGLLGDPEVMRFYPRPRTREETQGWIDWNKRNYAEHGYGLWIVETLDGQFVGDCGLTWQSVGDARCLEVGYHTVTSQQGLGHATEAARACLELATGTIGEQHVVAIINPDNTPSRRVAAKLGMQVEQEAVVSGRPVVVYGCTHRAGEPDVWELVHEERRSLIAFLETLDEEQWETPSLCPKWSVHDVVAHLVDSALTTRTSFVLGMVMARFDLDRQSKHGILREHTGVPAETLARFREVAGRTTGPPAPLDTRLVEAVVHGEDIRRPLRDDHVYAPQAVERALRQQARTSIFFGGGKERLSDVSIHARDVDLVLGEGPEVVGPALALLMTLSGRQPYLDQLTGPGFHAYAEWV